MYKERKSDASDFNESGSHQRSTGLESHVTLVGKPVSS